MWRQDDTYENEFGKCAFLEGTINVIFVIFEKDLLMFLRETVNKGE